MVPTKEADHNLPIVLIAEAGPRYLNFYKRLLLHRVDWTAKRGRKTANTTIVEESAEAADNMNIQLVWEGTTSDHVFPKWTIKDYRSEAEGRKQFVDRRVEEYWDMVLAKVRQGWPS